MRVSYRWLCELLPDLKAPAAEVADRLTNSGLEVEAIEAFGGGLDQVRIARVQQVEPHPSRERLSLVTVERESGRSQRVVCGAPNVPPPGGLVVLAPLGTTLPAVGITLEPRKIAGVVSEGMLCSEAELGLGEDAGGILVLAADTGAPGTPLAEALPAASDTIFDIGVTPNRADALGHIGVARDLAALYGVDVVLPEARVSRTADAKLDTLIAVDNQDPERCPHYGAAAVLDVQVGPSPPWLRWRLHSLGIRPISNVVDITNLLLLESGHPMHAFDLDRVRDARIVIRRAETGELFTTLDEVERKLDADDLVICDGRGPTALAGVMGGADSEIRASTQRVLLECAYFTPRGIRRTARRHGMQTDSSYRFERGVDWGGVPRVLGRARALLTQLAGGAAVDGAIHARPTELEIPALKLRARRLNAILGVPVPFTDACSILARLGLAVGSVRGEGDDAVAEVRGASWRPDIKREIDLIEEVARIRGLDAIPTVLPRIAPKPPRPTGALERRLGEIATSLGLSEALCYAFLSPRELEAVGADAPTVQLLNPLSEERSVMRTSLLPGLLEALRRAGRRGERSVRLYTLGSRYLAPVSGEQTRAAQAARPRQAADVATLPEERPTFAAVLSGVRPGHLERQEVDVYDAKGLAVELVERVTGQSTTVRSPTASATTRHLHPRGAGEILVGDTRVGTFGPLHPEVRGALDLDGSALVVELDLPALEACQSATPTYRPVPRHPAVTRDISLEASEEVTAGSLQQAIEEAAGADLCENVELLDVFTGGKIARGSRSLTFRVVYRDRGYLTAPDQARTLTDKEVDARHAKVTRATEALGARQRM